MMDEEIRSSTSAHDTMITLMDTVSVVTGLLRLCLVVAVFYLNCRALIDVCFRSSLCVHNLVSTAVVLANILYLITWPPFLLYGLSAANGAGSGHYVGWTPVNEQIFCLSQNYVVNAMGMVLLSLLVVRMADRFRETVLRWPPLGRTRNVLFTFLMWILPQFLYDLVSLATNANSCANRRHRRPVFHFLGEIVRIVTPASMSLSSSSSSSDVRHSSTEAAGYSLGFMVCEQELTDVVMAFHLWQYLVLVVPYAVAAILFGSAISMSIRRPRNRHTTGITTDHFAYLSVSGRLLESHDADTNEDTTDEDGCGHRCRIRITVIDLILYSNMLWHLVGRPLIIAHALYWPPSSPDSDGRQDPPTFLDVGSHLMLAVSCCLAPTICGLRLASSSSNAIVGRSVCVLGIKIGRRQRRTPRRRPDERISKQTCSTSGFGVQDDDDDGAPQKMGRTSSR